MTLQEFAALKVGDKIENHMSNSHGEVVTTDASGVRVCWDRAGQLPEGEVTWHYSVTSRAWSHWSKAEELPASLDPPGVRAEDGT